MSKVDIVLVNPNDKKKTYGDLAKSLSGSEPPLWHALLAAFLREKGFEVRIVEVRCFPCSIFRSALTALFPSCTITRTFGP